MKLKSLLLGSAAVFVAVSGARAADAIVVEPEPVEYVRVCDAYGAGWYYIPGTETCLKFAGQLRVTYDVRTYDHVDNIENHTDSYRFRFHVYANNETEYGTLSSWVRYTTANADQGEATNPVIIDNAVISLAGFRIGRLSDSYWDNTGGAFFTNGTRSPATFAFYGATAAWFADYTWAANGWTATFGVQDPTNDSAFAASTIGRPDLYAGITYEASGLGLRGVVAYDSGTSWSDGGLAWKGGFTYDMGSGYSLGAWYGSDDGETDYIGGHIWGVTAKMNLMENVSLAGYFSQFDEEGTGTASAWGTELRWDIVPGLDITVGWEKVYGDSVNSILDGYDSVDAFRLAFTRRF